MSTEFKLCRCFSKSFLGESPGHPGIVMLVYEHVSYSLHWDDVMFSFLSGVRRRCIGGSG